LEVHGNHNPRKVRALCATRGEYIAGQLRFVKIRVVPSWAAPTSLCRANARSLGIGWASEPFPKRTSSHEGLCRLLLDLFAADELRQFMHFRLGGAFMHRLPGANSPAFSFAFETCLALERRGWITDAFYDALVDERPGREADIRRVQRGRS